MSLVTLAQLREDIRLEYNLPTITSTSFVTTTALTRLVNQAANSYYKLLTECYGDGYLTKSATITTIAGLDISSLPSDFLTLKKLYWVRGTADIVPLHIANNDNLLINNYGSQSWSNYTPRYKLEDTVIRWFPTPSAIYTVLVDYIYQPVALSVDSDTVDVKLNGDLFIIYEVCRRIAIREDKDPSVFMFERDRVAKEIKELASERDESANKILRGINSTYQESTQQRRDRLTNYG
jgi:hypothetical protein